jgi:DNA-binding transcriptional ArsR family regulator
MKKRDDRYGTDADATDALFHALANRERRRMLDCIRAHPGCNVVSVAALHDISRIAVLKHLAVLERAGLVVSRKEGRERRLNFNVVPIQLVYERWATDFVKHWASGLTALKRAVELDPAATRSGRSAWSTRATKPSSGSTSRARSKRSGAS